MVQGRKGVQVPPQGLRIWQYVKRVQVQGEHKER